MSCGAPAPHLVSEVAQLLIARGLTLGLAESATGGLLSTWLTSIPGCSAFFRGAVVAYDNEVKVRLLGVHQKTLVQYGAVSESVASEMASGARVQLGSKLGLADTGIAGPLGATAGKPIGLFYFALASEEGSTVQQCQFSGDRLSIRRQATIAALQLLQQWLETGEQQ